MRRGLTLAACLLLLAAGAPAAGDVTPPRTIPVPVGATAPVSSELRYAAFPSTATLPDGSCLSVYKIAASHWGPTSQVISRRSADGVAWSDGRVMPGLAAGYVWAPAGLAVEPQQHGGRVYMAVLRQQYGTSPYVPTGTAAWVFWSGDNGTTWTQGPQLPTAPGSWGFYPSAMAVQPDGTVWVAGYTSDGAARYLRSTDRGGTFTASGVVTIPGRVAQEPTLGVLSDGRLFSLIRSDHAYNPWLYVTTMTAAGTWVAPVVATYDGSGLPVPAVVDDHNIIALYRGWTDRTDPTQGMPVRALMLGVNSAGEVRSWRGNIDLRPGHHGRFLYGNTVRCGGAWHVVAGVEGPGGAESPSAQVVSIPIEFREVP